MSEEVRNDVIEEVEDVEVTELEPIEVDPETEGTSGIGKAVVIAGVAGVVAGVVTIIKKLPAIKQRARDRKIEKAKDLLVENGYNCIYEDEAVIIEEYSEDVEIPDEE